MTPKGAFNNKWTATSRTKSTLFSVGVPRFEHGNLPTRRDAIAVERKNKKREQK